MSDNLKLSIWDAFTYFLSGCVVAISIYLQLASIDFPFAEKLSLFPSSVLGVSAVLVPILLGLFFEPIGNLVGDFVKSFAERLRWIWMRRPFSWVFKVDFEESNKLKKAVAEDIPVALRGNFSPFHWAKDFLSQEEIETPYMDFLAKFGFYRNIGSLLLLNAVCLGFLHESLDAFWWVYVSLLIGSAVYFWRSEKFYTHLGNSAYRHYLVQIERTKRGKTNGKKSSTEKGKD